MILDVQRHSRRMDDSADRSLNYRARRHVSVICNLPHANKSQSLTSPWRSDCSVCGPVVQFVHRVTRSVADDVANRNEYLTSVRINLNLPWAFEHSRLRTTDRRFRRHIAVVSAIEDKQS